VCASQQDTGEERQPPDTPQLLALSPPSSRTPRRSHILRTFRASRGPRPVGEPLPGEAQVPAPEPVSVALEPRNGSEPPTRSGPLPETKPPTASERPPGEDSPHPLGQPQSFETADAGLHATRLLDASLIVIGAAFFLSALATLSSTWAWSWHAGAGRTFNLSHMHGICTSAMGELAQGASGTVASHCLWVDGIWTEAIGLTGGGCILVVIGIARILGALRTPA